MKPLVSVIIGVALVSGAALAYADVVTDWNQTAIEVLAAANVKMGAWPRGMAMVHVAMSDAVNTIQGRYARYAAAGPAAPNASAEAAAAAAARHMLIHLYPSQKARVDEAYAASLTSMSDGSTKDEGIAVGERVASRVYGQRSNDGTAGPDTYRPITSPGVWIPTMIPQYATFQPWGLKAADQFRPAPPPPLSSALYARDYNETKEIGRSKSVTRTPQQTEAIRFWLDGTFNRGWNEAARELAARQGLGVAESARLFALLNMSLADAFVAYADANRHYNFWRPITAIRNGDVDGNNATERDAGWMPLSVTPMSPEYPSSAATLSGAGAGVLESVFGAGAVPTFAVTDSADARVKRRFNRIAHMAEEHRVVRLWGGIHFRNSLEVGEAMGRQVAGYLLSNYLKPAP